MNKYEAMFMVKPDLSDADKKNLFNVITEAIAKNNGSVVTAAVWLERRKLYFPIKKQREALYYLVNFTMPPLSEKEIRHAYKLNEDILRVLVTKLE